MRRLGDHDLSTYRHGGYELYGGVIEHSDLHIMHWETGKTRILGNRHM